MRALFVWNMRNKVRLFMVLVVVILAGASYFGEKVAKDDGIGWDGEIYIDTIRNFSDKITNNGYDQYEIHRIFPLGLLNLFFRLSGVTNISVNEALVAVGFISALAILISIFFFFRISSLLKWKLGTEVIAFSSLFFSYPILKIAGYYILLADIYGFLLAMMLVYYFLTRNNVAIIICGFLGAFTWPVASACAFALAFFPRDPLRLSDKLQKGDSWAYRTVCLSLGMLPLAYYLARGLYHHSWTEGAYSLSRLESMPEVAIPLTIVSCLCSCLYIYYMVRPFKISLSGALSIFCSWKTWANLAAFFVCSILVSIVCKLLASDAAGAVASPIDLFQRVIRGSMGLPFAPAESSIVYYGPCIIGVFLCWKSIVPYILEKGLGYLFVVAIGIFLSVAPESRSYVFSLPFIIIAMMQYWDTIPFKKWFPLSFVVVSLVFSRFWFRINADGMAEALSWENYSNYLDFPAQRYFMSTGNWQSPTMYVVFMAILIPLFILFVVGRKKGWFVEKSN